MDPLLPASITARIVDTVTTGIIVCMESAAQLPIGQTILRFIDRFLWVVEKSTQWSLPLQEESTEGNGESFGTTTLVRPLPWIFFLPGLILLRLLRAGVNIGAFILGYPTLRPSVIVKYLQKSRNRLRIIKTNGMRNMRRRPNNGTAQDCEEILAGDAKWRSIELIRSIQLTLSSLSCLDSSKLSPSPPPTQIKVSMNHETSQRPTPGEQSTTESTSGARHLEPKRRHSEVSSDDSDSSLDSVRRLLEESVYHPNPDGELIPAFMPTAYHKGTKRSSSRVNDAAADEEIRQLQTEADTLMDRAMIRYRDEKAENREVPKRANSDKRTGQMTEFENPNVVNASENSREKQEFHSPCEKFGEDGDSTFYSPISSKSSSPERAPPALEQGQKISPEDVGLETQQVYRNGAPTKTINGHGVDNHANDHETKINKPNYKGRRTSNASRKKK